MNEQRRWLMSVYIPYHVANVTNGRQPNKVELDWLSECLDDFVFVTGRMPVTASELALDLVLVSAEY